MKGLFKGRYLIAIYDENDQLKDVGCLAKELINYKNNHSAISKAFSRSKGGNKRIYFIDVLEKHDDVFAEEDEIFLEYLKENTKKTIKEKAEELGITERQYYRKHKSFNSDIEREM